MSRHVGSRGDPAPLTPIDALRELMQRKHVTQTLAKLVELLRADAGPFIWTVSYALRRS
jgi:hypothetical protein